MATKKKTDQLEQDHYFVSLNAPLEFRRQILESSKKAVQSMQVNQRLALLRQEKLAELTALKTSLDELLYLNKKLLERLPATDTLPDQPTERKIFLKSAIPTTSKADATGARVDSRSDLDRLEDALNAIEERLKTLK